MARWFVKRVPAYIRSATLQGSLARPGSVDQIKADMMNGTFRFESPEGRVTGWRDENGIYYINEGHHRINAALEVFWSTSDDVFLRQLLDNGRWRPGRPKMRGRFPTRSIWSNLLHQLGW